MREWTRQGMARHLGLLCVLLTLPWVLPACGDAPGEAPAAPPPSEDGAAHDAPLPRPSDIVEELPGQIVGMAPDLDTAWEALHDESAWVRRQGIDRLLAADATFEELLHHAVRVTRWGRDVGLLADLLMLEPHRAVEPLLEHIWRSHNLARFKLMAALGRRRDDVGPALGILLLQTAGAEDRKVCLAAFQAIVSLVHDWEPGVGPNSKRSGPSLTVLAARRLATVPEEERNWTEEGVWASFFRSLHIEGEFYGEQYVARLMPMLKEVSLTNDLRARVAYAVAMHGPESFVAPRLLVDAGVHGFDNAQAMLRKRECLHAALAAAPHMGGRATLLVDDILPLLRENHDQDMVLAALGSFGTRLSEEAQIAIYEAWRRARADALREQRPAWSGSAVHVLQLARPRRALVQRLRALLQDPAADVAEKRVALQLLGWAHASVRREACAAVAAFAEAVAKDKPAARALRISLASARQTCAHQEAWLETRSQAMLAESPSLRPFLLASAR